MRLCLASLHPRILSGQIDSLAGLGRALDQRGHSVTLVAPFDTSALLYKPLTELDGGPQPLATAAAAMLTAIPRILVASKDCDVLHLALPTPAFGWLADVIHMASKAPILVSFEGHLAQASQVLNIMRRPRTLTGYLPLWLVNNGLFGRMSAHLCERYVVSSEYQREELLALGVPSERITVLTNVIEDGKLRGCEQPRARRSLGLDPDKPTIGYIGHFNDVKGADLLAGAFASLIDSGNDFSLALAWSGQGDPEPVTSRLRHVKSHVTWLGKIDVGAFLCAIDVLALPYRATAGQAAFPSLVLEALHAGRPLVTSSLPLLAEIARDQEVALLCPPDRPDVLASQLERLLCSEPLRRRMSRAQMRLARERFSTPLLVRRYERMYATLIGQPIRRIEAAA